MKTFTLPMRLFRRSLLCLLTTLLLYACNNDSSTDLLPLFEGVSEEKSKINFINRLRESPSQNVLTYEYFYNGAGLAVADFNQDNYPDIYFVSNLEANQLYLNQQDFSFKEVASISRVAGRKGFDTGVSLVDINADGLMDIYLCKSGRFTQLDLRRNELYVNQGNNEEGIPIFTEQAKAYGLDIAAYSTQSSFFDYDKDGDLDLFLINHDIDTYEVNDIAGLQNQSSEWVGERLYKNESGYFSDVTQEAGIINNQLGFGLGLAVGDLNNDGYPDVYVSNDYSGKDHLYINQQDGTFREKIRELTAHTSFYAMGNDIGDINNDGWLDIVNLDMVAQDNYGIKTSMSAMNPEQFQNLVALGEHRQYMFNSLLINNGVAVENRDPQFSNIAQLLGISNTDWSWAPLLFDMNNDGYQDLFITNGIKRNIRYNDAIKKVQTLQQQLQADPSPQAKARYFQLMLQQFPYHRKPNYFFLNQGDLVFEDISKALGQDSLPTASNGAAYADLDLDGDLDLIINNVDQPATLLRNNSQQNADAHYLTIQLKGPALNPFGIGMRITLRANNQSQTKELYTSRGYLSASPPLLHFGLQPCERIDQLLIQWPDGRAESRSNIQPNQHLVIDHQTSALPSASPALRPQIFADISKDLIQHQHRENAFDDFARELLLPHRMSNSGPALATGDVDGNGTVDLFIGGAAGRPATLYLQGDAGEMRRSQLDTWAADKQLEDVEACLLDADQDGDLDLIVGGGSNEWPAGAEAYRLRYFENEGGGRFRKNEAVLPDLRLSVGAIRPADFDGDGDLDVFVGGRQQPGQYPRPADSYLLLNQSGGGEAQFENVTPQWAPFLQAFGMVTDAIWVDVNQDQRLDLVTTGEWMSPRILLNDGQQFIDHTEAANLHEETGWWYSLASADFDQDGDPDLIAGNLGLNYKYKASKTAPFEIYTNDFDQSGNQDIVLGYYSDDTLFPLRGRECSSSQMPFIKKKFASYEAFGKASLQEVYPAAALESAVHYSATNFASCYFENDGTGRFKVRPLPRMAQWSSVNDLLIQDFDKDTNLDILLAGNLYEAEVETPRNDASIGLLLKGDGSGNFTAIPAFDSGLQILGEVKHIQPWDWKGASEPTLLLGKRDTTAWQLIKLQNPIHQIK
ncbi:MAG: FG-GAP-like repeat-containing protein [Bacteroidota bacterium]